jgi:hypothetical protein
MRLAESTARRSDREHPPPDEYLTNGPREIENQNSYMSPRGAQRMAQRRGRNEQK